MNLESSWDASNPSWPMSTGDVASSPAHLGDPSPSASNSTELIAGVGCQALPPWVPAAEGLKDLVCLQLHLARTAASVTKLETMYLSQTF